MRLELKDTLKHRGVGRTLLLSILFFTSMSATADALFEATGYGNFEVQPDEVRFHSSVTRVKVDAREAQNEVNAIVLRLEKTVDRYDVLEDTLDSSVISVNPDYEWDSMTKKQVFVGYRVTRSLSFTVRGTSEIGTILASLSDSGATQISPPSLQYSQPHDAARKALQNAVANAMDKLQVMASAVNSSISDVVSVTEITERSPAPMRGEMRIAAATLADSPSPVSVAALSYRAQVTVSANGD